MPARPFVDFVVPDVLMEDGDKPDMPGWDLTALWTPGHSPGHLCFWEATNRLMLTGDCVLPRITPNVNLNPQTEPDPLGDYLRSLERWRSSTPTRPCPRTSGAMSATAPACSRSAPTTSTGSSR